MVVADDGQGPAEHVRVFAAVPRQVGKARRFLAGLLGDCPASDEIILCLSELASNCVRHSASNSPGGQFTVLAEIVPGNYVRIELRDDGGPWASCGGRDDRPHGLDIVRAVATDSGVSGDARTGWISWAVLDWSAPGQQPDGADRVP